MIEQLLSRFDQLAARFERLEQAVALSSGDLDRVTAGEAGRHALGRGYATPRNRARNRWQPMRRLRRAVRKPPAARSAPATPEQQSATTSQGQGPESTGAPERQETAQQQAPAPGQVEVDEEAAERALDFTLVQEGALLLPFGSSRSSRRASPIPAGPAIFRSSWIPGPVVGEEEVRRNEFEFLASLFVGLPFDSQLELGLPYNLVEQ